MMQERQFLDQKDSVHAVQDTKPPVRTLCIYTVIPFDQQAVILFKS